MSGHLIPPDRRDERWSFRQAAVFGAVVVAAAGVLVAYPPQRLLGSVFGVSSAPAVRPASDAYGASGAVRMQVRLPGDSFTFPLDTGGGEGAAAYQWVRAVDSGAVTPEAPLVRGSVRAPERPGLYHLAVSTGESRAVLDDVVIAVLVPFAEKMGSSINGYRIGTYRQERGGVAGSAPRGFVEVWPADTSVRVTHHLRLADFLTQDGQAGWPRYLALDERILDKVELVLDRLGARERILTVDVHSGFRTPLHNRRVPRAATDSRHQYGDAIDLALDADGDGRVSFFDALAVARAVELVEQEFPALVGGMGVYGNRGNAPYVHIDVRGERKRWRG